MTYYLDFEEACVVVDATRAAAQAAGDMRMAPPPLAECRASIVASALGGPAEGSADQEYYPTLPLKAAVLAYRIVNGHPCPDGNKRLALVLVYAFLKANGRILDASPDEIDHVFRHVAASESPQYDDTLKMFSHWFEHAITLLGEE